MTLFITLEDCQTRERLVFSNLPALFAFLSASGQPDALDREPEPEG